MSPEHEQVASGLPVGGDQRGSVCIVAFRLADAARRPDSSFSPTRIRPDGMGKPLPYDPKPRPGCSADTDCLARGAGATFWLAIVDTFRTLAPGRGGPELISPEGAKSKRSAPG